MPVAAFALWPVLWVSPPWHIVETLKVLSKYPDGGSVLYYGQVFKYDEFIKPLPVSFGPFTVDIPAHATFIPTWTAISTPDATLIFLAVGLLALAAWATMGGRLGRLPGAWWGWLLVLAWFLGPVIAAALKASSHTRSGRHFLFMVPAVALLASMGLWRVWSSRWRPAAWAGMALAAVLYLDVAWATARLFPYENLYFNRVSGGLPGAVGKFDVEYWSQSFDDAFEWLAREHPGAKVHAVASIDVAAHACRRLGLTHNPPLPEYFVSMVIQGWEDKLPGPVVHTVERDGVPLAVVRRVEPRLTALRRLTVAGREVRGESGRFGLDVQLDRPDLSGQESGREARVAGTFTLIADERWAGGKPFPLLVGFKGSGSVDVNGFDLKTAVRVPDRLRFLAHDAFACLNRVEITLHPGRNVVGVSALIRHDPHVYIHWPETPGVSEAETE
jgi:hypothetical protein